MEILSYIWIPFAVIWDIWSYVWDKFWWILLPLFLYYEFVHPFTERIGRLERRLNKLEGHFPENEDGELIE